MLTKKGKIFRAHPGTGPLLFNADLPITSSLSEETSPFDFEGFDGGEWGGGGATGSFDSDEFIPPTIPVADLVALFDMEENEAYDVFVRYAHYTKYLPL